MGRVVGFELNSQEPEKAAAFYAKVFGWEVAAPNWEYRGVTTGDDNKSGINGGIAKGPHDYPFGTRIQIEVDSIDEAISKARKMVPLLYEIKWNLMNFTLPIC
ncbi:hypothetical protein SAMN06295926_12426 [Lysinibacillus sp. AC-3]|nr:hypothetical protein SAMN06295926_12426 [Lysinibacillus sp. AC-3]